MTMRLYNTLTNQKELFEPLAPGKVGIYLCGPTVYKPSHIGHAVGPIIFDVMKRYLTFKGFAVKLVVNITDVDDKLINESAAQGVSVPDLARRIEQEYVAAMRRLGVRSIDAMPRASEHIAEIIASIERLISIGYGYPAHGNVYFDVAKYADYGRLSNRKPEELLAGTRDDLVADGKHHPGDFALWKAAKPGEPPEVVYPSPWGPGRPGWHIECSAMSAKYLGESFDIHGGGMDLIFPHHENERAQSECATGKPFARYWVHNGLTRFNTKKISKSDAEMQDMMSQLALSRLLDQHGPELLRFIIISSHYRSPLDFSPTTLQAAGKGLQTFYRLFDRLARLTRRSAYTLTTRSEQVREKAGGGPAKEFFERILARQLEFLRHMDDDLNTAAAIGVLFEIATDINRHIETTRLEMQAEADGATLVEAATATLIALGRLLGLFEEPPARVSAEADESSTKALVELLVEVRQRAKSAKQFELADFIRKGLSDVGVTLNDRPGGTEWTRA